jgi:signal transduction histidine kinase
MNGPLPRNRRILLVDDNPTIHDDFRRILVPDRSSGDLDAEAARLFGLAASSTGSVPEFEVDFALQGEEALALLIQARAAGRPYALAFVDMRMPPGWDGLTTIQKLWAEDSDLQVVICTAYSDHSWDEIRSKLPTSERWLVLKKPFDKVEAVQLANALTEKWSLGQMARLQVSALEEAVELRTEQLRRSIQIKNEFLANVSHELLTPMNGVIGMLEALAESEPNAVQASYVSDASGCANDLLRLMQQILAFNQAEAGTLALDPVNVSPQRLIAGVVETCRPGAAHKGLEIVAAVDSGCPGTFWAPAAVIAQILSALVDNAVKFTASGSVTVRASGDYERILFAVEDTGIGLTDEQIEWLGLPFAQINGQHSRRTNGLGLGIPTAKRLSALLGGSFSIGRREGGGTTASFSIQASKDRARQLAS